jgi:cytochrome c oxidase assembly protein subunit 15
MSAILLSPSEPSPAQSAVVTRSNAVRTWLLIVVAMVVGMVAVGGATRLTGSGLSITEWRPVTGMIPPLSPASWAAEFARYQASPQYDILNRGMPLADFKVIYWWEWSHRQLGRVLGLAFLLPLAWFWWRGAIGSRLAAVLLGLGALGGLQATVGWIMVASGLKPGMVAVAPTKLMIHLTLASIILAALVWIATGLRETRPAALADPAARRLGRGASWLLGLVLLQIALGGLVAGSHAGLTFNTWPLMDGRLVPGAEQLFPVQPWFENFFANPALIQFNHRLMAYAVVGFALWHAWTARRVAPVGHPFRNQALLLAGLAVAQMVLGITTLLLAVPLWAGLAHQLLAIALLAAATVHARLSRAENRPARLIAA